MLFVDADACAGDRLRVGPPRSRRPRQLHHPPDAEPHRRRRRLVAGGAAADQRRQFTFRLADPTTVMAVSDTAVLRTQDNGATWQAVPLPLGVQVLTGFRAFSAQRFVLADEFSQTWLSTDGGASWQRRNAGGVAQATLNSIWFFDSRERPGDRRRRQLGPHHRRRQDLGRGRERQRRLVSAAVPRRRQRRLADLAARHDRPLGRQGPHLDPAVRRGERLAFRRHRLPLHRRAARLGGRALRQRPGHGLHHQSTAASAGRSWQRRRARRASTRSASPTRCTASRSARPGSRWCPRMAARPGRRARPAPSASCSASPLPTPRPRSRSAKAASSSARPMPARAGSRSRARPRAR